MGSEFSLERIQPMKDEAYESMKEAIDELRRDEPKVVDSAAATVGSVLGGGASFTALHFAGGTGLSAAAGYGLAAAATRLVAPVAALAVVGSVWYAIAMKRRNAKLAAALNRAIEKLHATEERLMANAEYFREELAELKAWIEELERRRPQ